MFQARRAACYHSDEARFKRFIRGYDDIDVVSVAELQIIPWLMIEAMVAESAIPVANQGTFAELQGSAFMDLVSRKCEWVRQHRKSISAL